MIKRFLMAILVVMTALAIPATAVQKRPLKKVPGKSTTRKPAQKKPVRPKTVPKKPAPPPVVLKGPLNGWAVIIDPGHGGEDPGANGIFEKKPVYEAAYTYDIALRVKRLVTANGGVPFLTILDGQKENNDPAWKVFPFDHSAKFALDGSRVVTMTRGLTKRLGYGNTINQKYPKSKKAWISIHFDKLGSNTEIQGVRIIAADTDLALAKSIAKSFGDAHRLRVDDPVVASGDKDHGLRRLYILSGRNQIKQKILIELGNFNNKTDMYRIRAAIVRDAWATAIVRGIVQF